MSGLCIQRHLENDKFLLTSNLPFFDSITTYLNGRQDCMNITRKYRSMHIRIRIYHQLVISKHVNLLRYITCKIVTTF